VSIWTRVLNWVHDLGVTVAGAANVAVPVDDLRPRAKHVQITLDAVDDIRFCEKFFDKWMTVLDKCVANRFSWPRVPLLITGLQCNERLQEARWTRANAENLSWAPEGTGWAGLEHNQRDPSTPCSVRVSDGPADR
jgi:hypothetical protein